MSDVDPVIFREYIGVKPYPPSLINFPDIINPDVKQFHFILGFAKDTYDADGKGTGNFKANWNNDFFGPESVRDLKRKHPQVKVVISIGGRDADCPFLPDAKDEWCDNAVNSLEEIIRSYNDHSDVILIDGIDINYVHIKSSNDDFHDCIGKVIKGLKQHVNVVSIAPSANSQIPYQKLYLDLDMASDINYVDYQFYTHNIDSKDDFVTLFHSLSGKEKTYPPEKFLVGGSTDPSDAKNFTREVFIEGCKELVKAASLCGIFIWNANDSANDVPPFYLEKKAQEIIAKKD